MKAQWSRERASRALAPTPGTGRARRRLGDVAGLALVLLAAPPRGQLHWGVRAQVASPFDPSGGGPVAMPYDGTMPPEIYELPTTITRVVMGQLHTCVIISDAGVARLKWCARARLQRRALARCAPRRAARADHPARAPCGARARARAASGTVTRARRAMATRRGAGTTRARWAPRCRTCSCRPGWASPTSPRA